MSDLRVVVTAENVSTQFGGEALDPLHYFRVLRARKVEAWLVAHNRTQAELQKLFPEDCDRLNFVPDTWLHQMLCNWGQFLPGRIAAVTTGMLSYLYSQSIQRRIVRKLVQEHKIDVVHEPIPLAPKYPSLMFDVGAPVLIGPLNGDMEFPTAFRSRQSYLVELTVTLGRKVANLCNHIIPGKLKAHTLLVANERTKNALPKGVRGRVVELVDNGVDLSVWQSTVPVPKKSNQRVHFVYVGRLDDWKAVDLLLEAFPKVAAETNAMLEIIGDGKLRQELEAQTARLGLTGSVVFTGWVPQKECAVKLRQADVMVLPSLRECGGAVVLEAMAVGLPVIATNWGGPADYLDETCGILVEPSSKEAFISGLANSMVKLAQSPDLRHEMACAGQERVRQYFDWERKVDQVMEIYSSAAGKRIDNEARATVEVK